MGLDIAWRPALGGACWAASIAVLGSIAARAAERAISLPPPLFMIEVAWSVPLVVGLFSIVQRRAEAVGLLGGIAIGMVLDESWGGRSAGPVISAVALSALGARWRGNELLPWARTASLLALGALGILLAHAVLFDLVVANSGRFGGDLAMQPAWWLRTALELASLCTLASFARGQTSGLIGLVVFGTAWLIHGALVAVPEAVCGCTGCNGHPFALGLREPAAWLLVLAVLPWVVPVARHLLGRPPA
jgi:hypothetical protein